MAAFFVGHRKIKFFNTGDIELHRVGLGVSLGSRPHRF
jgi:hypothetical protein